MQETGYSTLTDSLVNGPWNSAWKNGKTLPDTEKLPTEDLPVLQESLIILM